MTQPFVIGGNPGMGSGGGNSSANPLQLGASIWYPAGGGITLHTGKVVGWNNAGLASADANTNIGAFSLGTAPAYNATDAAYNNNPSVQFAGAQALITGTWASAIAAPMTVAWVGEADSLTGSAAFFFDDLTTLERAAVFVDDVPQAIMIHTGDGEIATTAVPAGPTIWVAAFDSGGSGMLYATNGGPPLPLVGAQAQTFAGATLTGLTLGSFAQGAGFGDFLTGKIVEMAVWNRVLSINDMASLFSYWTKF